MSQPHNINSHDPRKAPDLVPMPKFSIWDVIFFSDPPETSLRRVDEIIFGHWDDYADQAIRILHQMIKQTEDLVFGDDEYTDLVCTFQAFPHRPNLSAVLRNNVYNEHEDFTNMETELTQTPVEKVWHMWAARVEMIYRDLATRMSRCKIQPAKRDEGDFGIAHLSLSAKLPKTETMTGLLHQMLDSASEPDEESQDTKTGLETRMQHMGI